jgi:hypothetical protein
MTGKVPLDLLSGRRGAATPTIANGLIADALDNDGGLTAAYA